MAIDAGTVYYTVDAKTQKAIDSATEMKDSLEQMQTSMAKTDLQARQYTKSLIEAGNSVSKAGVVIDQFGNVNAEATAKMQKLMAMTDSLNQRHIQLSKTATGVRNGLAGMGRGAGQAGIQFQQLIGQIQGGQDVMLALSQQSADLGFVLGAPLVGAIVGIGASLAGLAINAMSTTGVLEEFIEKLEELDSKGFASLQGQEQATAIAKLEKEIKKTTHERQKQIDKVEELRKKEKELEQQREEARSKGFAGAVETARINATREAIEAAQITIQKYDREIEDNQKNLGILNGEISANEEEIQSQISALETAAGAFGKIGVALIEYNKKITISKLEALGATEGEIEKTKAIFDAMIATQQATDAAEKKAESDRKAAKEARDRAKAENESKEASQNFVKNFGLSGEKDVFQSNPDSDATDFSRTITSKYDEESALERLDRERGMVQMYQDLEIGDAQAHADAIKAIDQEIADEKKKALDDQVKEQRNATNAQLNIYSQLFSGMQSLTSNMLASMDEQSSGYKAMFAVNKAFAVAQAIVSAELAAAQVLAHDAGIMGMSAAATSNAIRAMGYASAGVIAGTAITGGRLYGGAVQANGMYRINENGAPEVFNAANGQQYMLPNTRGEVVSNKDASGGGTTMINITVNADGSISGNGGAEMQQLGKEISKLVDARINQAQVKSMKQGGALWQYLQKGGK
ncbi:hypothetical protein KW517_00400 [Vibrio fluvialis]|nr:hypothetical protein [Vibrio fluvialis]